MVSRMEVVDMLNSDENVYRSRLIEMFETQRDTHFCRSLRILYLM